MRMTIEELMAWDTKKFSLEEWEAEVKRRKLIDKKIRKLSDEIDGEVQSLEVLKDEIGSDRWMKHNNRMFNLIGKRDKLMREIGEG